MSGGAGGAGGAPYGTTGFPGTTGTNDYSSTYGGEGGDNGFRVINGEFKLGSGSVANRSIHAVSYPVYNEFLNTYGVWTNSDAVSPVGSWETTVYTTDITESGTYTLVCSADNHIRVYIYSSLVGSNDDWASTNTSSVALTAGRIDIQCDALNDGGPASFSASLTNSAGQVVWHTRSPLYNNTLSGQSYGHGGAGANAPDRVRPYNWAGNPGQSGAVFFKW